MSSNAPSRGNRWILFALASGACAAFNGVFAKLTTTELTSGFSQAVARIIGLSSVETAVEYIVRAIFFGLNLAFNGIMWSLFTTALKRGNSTTQVSIMNTSSNFVITAVLSSLIFAEALPPLWWLGAAMLIAGNVIIGRKDESAPAAAAAADSASLPAFADERSDGADVLLGEGVESAAPKGRAEDEDILDLGGSD